MCGLVGSISHRPEDQIIHVEKMLQAILHRGPDGNAVAQAGAAIFGHCRLAILDLSEQANQPMWDASQKFCLVFNGEIYNYAILRQELKNLGYSFRTQSDTEVLLNAWIEWGPNTLEKLTGMFAFAIWDIAARTLVLARDRMGEKPLFYTGFEGDLQKGLIFGSELKALAVHPTVKKTLSLPAISEFLSQNYLSTESCIFEDIYKLPPAHYLTYQLGETPKLKCYWQLEDFFHQKTTLGFADAQDQLLHLLNQTVSQQSYADVPVGAFLSGGIDSSTIVAEMARKQSKNIQTFSMGFKEKSFNELPASEVTAKHLQVSHQTKIISPDIQNVLPQLAYTFDEPFADSSMIPTYFLSKLARQSVKVSLSGDGGDELFGGYVTYQADRLHRYCSKLPKFAIKALHQLIHYSGPTSFSKISLDYKIKHFLKGCLQDFQQAHVGWRSIFSIDEKITLFHPEYQSIAMLDPFNKIEPLFQRVKDCHYLDQAMYVDMKTWLVDDILVKVDRASMANSLEVRAPFLDHHIVEFAASLPMHYKIKGATGKHILKKSQTQFLPKIVRKRRKEGFNAPIAFWLNNELFDMAYSLTTSSSLLRWFDKSAIEKLWKQHKNMQQDNSLKLFGLTNLALWLDAFNI